MARSMPLSNSAHLLKAIDRDDSASVRGLEQLLPLSANTAIMATNFSIDRAPRLPSPLAA